MATEDLKAELEKVRQTLAASEGLRTTLPAEQVETILASLRAQEAELAGRIDGPPADAGKGKRQPHSDNSMPAQPIPSAGDGGRVKRKPRPGFNRKGAGRSGARAPSESESRKRSSKARVKGGGAIGQADHGGTSVVSGSRGLSVGRDLHGDVILGGGKAAQGPKQRVLRDGYLRHLIKECGAVSLSGIDPAVPSSDPKERLRLEAVYTALLTETSISLQELGRSIEGRAPVEVYRDASALELLDSHDRLVLLGDPGSGKSTFVSFVALCQAGELLGLSEANRELLTTALPGDEKPQPWHHAKLLPVRVILRDFAADGLPPDGEKATAGHLWRFIERQLAEASLAEYAPLLHARLLDKGAVVLLDGLDEVPEAERRRAQIREAVEDFAGTFSKCRFLVTSRTYAYQNQDWRLQGFDEAVLAPFSDEQIELFVSRWYAHMAALGRLKTEDAQGRAAVLWRAIAASDRLRELAARPLLLTLMASLHAWRGGSLPERREELYADAVNLLLDLWERQHVRRDARGELRLVQPSLAEWLRTDREAVRRVLEDLAFEAHAAQPDLGGTADISEDKLVGRLLRLARSEEANPLRLMEYLSQRSGLLVARGVGVYSLPHRTFQEYLAACRLTRDTFPVEVAELGRSDPGRWREVLLLAAAKAARGTPANVWMLAEHLCYLEPGDPEATLADAWGAHLAGQALVESANLEMVAEAHQGRLQLLRRWHVHLLREERLPPIERALAGQTLAALGDPRPSVTTLAAMELCWVPAGPFRMGSKKGDKDAADAEMEQREVDLPYLYGIARFPVTVAQFREYVERGGEAPGDRDALRGPSNTPVVWVSWHEALGFCRWLTSAWRDEGRLTGGWEVRLPSEAEWEKAARGGLESPAETPSMTTVGAPGTPPAACAQRPNPGPARGYPWGGGFDANRANCSPTEINSVSAVGCFPGGASPYGAEELSGNIWEWTRSRWAMYPYRPDDGREDVAGDDRRVLRGGAFDFSPRYARCAFRDRDNPGYRHLSIGFRAVVSPFRSEL